MKIDGCEFPDDLLYDPAGLVWARPLTSGEVEVGITSIYAAATELLAKQVAAFRVRCFAAFPDFEMFEIGVECAAVLVKLNELLVQVPVGEVVHLVTDDPTSPIEMVRWSDETGQSVIDERREGSLFHFLVRKVLKSTPRIEPRFDV